jgi:hypothetical protein
MDSDDQDYSSADESMEASEEASDESNDSGDYAFDAGADVIAALRKARAGGHARSLKPPATGA